MPVLNRAGMEIRDGHTANRPVLRPTSTGNPLQETVSVKVRPRVQRATAECTKQSCWMATVFGGNVEGRTRMPARSQTTPNQGEKEMKNDMAVCGYNKFMDSAEIGSVLSKLSFGGFRFGTPAGGLYRKLTQGGPLIYGN